MAKRSRQESSSLLLHEEPLQVLPSLAVAIGLNEAIILQQLHYWLKRSEHQMEGRAWIYNTYEQWRTQFPFWGLNTIKRAMHQLEHLELVISTTRFNRNPIDKTWWYTINYQRLNDFCEASTTQDGSSTTQDGSSTTQDGSSTTQDGSSTAQDGSSTAQNGLLDSPKWVIPRASKDPKELDPEITTETTKKERAREKNVRTILRPDYSPGFLQFWTCYPPERRASKPSCLGVWRAANLEPRTAEICEKIERLKATSWRDCQPTYIPMPLTWLNQGRYEDDLMPMRSVALGGRLSQSEQRTAAASQRIVEEMQHGSARPTGVSRRLE